MLKFVLIINSIALLIFNTFFGDGVSVSAKIPSSAAPGSEFPVEVTVKKGATSGFAKLQIDLPAGMTAQEVDSKGGAFAFNNNAAKYIWTALPGDEEFTIKFKVIVDAAASGTKTIQGKFSYIVNNVKQQVDIPASEISLGGAETSAAPTATATPTNTVPVTSTNTVTSTTEPTTSFNRPVEPAAAVSCMRTITPSSDGQQFDVELKLKKASIKGFAKLTENIPAGLTASQIKTSGASFTFSDQHAKFVWVSLPADEEITVAYRISVKQKPATNPVLTGEFSYLENEQTQKIQLAQDELKTGAPASPVATNTVAPTNTATVTSTPTVAVTNTVEPVSTTPANTVEPVTTNTVAPVETTPVATAKTGNVNYVVQIGAFRNGVDTKMLAAAYGISENIRTDMNEGYTKCLVGGFSEYKGARDHRENMKSKGVSDAFVAAYNSGRRITVQEALMISNQKWFR